jgi:perosamine synthetase
MSTVTKMIPHSRPSIEGDEIRAATDVLRSCQLAQGAVVEQFERGMAAYLGLAGGVAVSSGTAVILPSYVCAAPWLAVQRAGATPRLVDIELETFNLDPAAVRQTLTSKTRAVIVPHLFGLSADLTAFERLGVPIIEDCAQTLGAMEQGRTVGSAGLLTVCSFYATKLICAGEGGMVLSRDQTLLERARMLREYDGAPSLNPSATNLKMTDLQAAIGLAQLGRLASFLERRSWLAHEYRAALEGTGVVQPVVPAGRTHVYYRFVLRIPDLHTGVNGVSDVIARFEGRGVRCCKPVSRSLHRYLELEGFSASEEAERTAISIPLFPSLTDEDAAQIHMALHSEWS